MSKPGDIKRILFVTDAWRPQVNGVVRTLGKLADTLPGLGVETSFITPDQFKTVPMPSYPEIRLALAGRGHVGRRMDEARPDHVHIVTEGPLGLAARRHCIRQGRRFTTNYHTKFPEYLATRLPVPSSVTYALLRRFHNASSATLVATASLREELRQRGFVRLQSWTRGVDISHFNPAQRVELDFPRPIFLTVGRVSPEKNLEAFLNLELPGSKVVAGGGPALDSLKARHPDVYFLGNQADSDLARIYASSDVFVFPSRTDTFGIVLIEALASGLPVAAYPVTGPIDIIEPGVSGILSDDLGQAALRALKLDRGAARARAEQFSWDSCARMFLQRIAEVYSRAPPPVATPGATAPLPR